MNVIPAIDLVDGQCVRLLRGKFDNKTVYSDDPLALARDYETMGCDRLHVVDLDGARSGHLQNDAVIRSIAGSSGLAIQLGGGIRDESELDAWLNAGIDRVIIGSLAVTDAPLVRDWLASYGSEKIVLALDVTMPSGSAPQLVIHGWTRSTAMTLWECVDEFAQSGLKHVLCTDTGRDGALTGPNLDLYAQFLERYPDVCLQASGGIRSIDDLRALANLGVPVAISGRALLDGSITAREMRSFLRAA